MKFNFDCRLWTKAIAGAVISTCVITASTEAAIFIDFVYYETLDTTVASYAGTWGLDSDIDIVDPGEFDASIASTHFTSTGSSWSRATGGIVSPYPWASVPESESVVRSGDSFKFDDNFIYGPHGFTATTAIEGSISFIGYDLAELGFDAAEIENGGVLTGSGGSVSWTATAVPEIKAFALIGGLLALGCTLITRRGSSL